MGTDFLLSSSQFFQIRNCNASTRVGRGISGTGCATYSTVLVSYTPFPPNLNRQKGRSMCVVCWMLLSISMQCCMHCWIIHCYVMLDLLSCIRLITSLVCDGFKVLLGFLES